MHQLIAITGSIASGKSAVARALAGRLRAGGRSAAVIDLDLVYEMLAEDPKSDAATWAGARRLAGAIAAAAFADGVAFAILEGELWTAADRAELLVRVPARTRATWVTLNVSYAEALRRARGDPSRGISRDPAFLRAHMDEFQAALRDVPAADLVIDTERAGVEEIAARLAGAALPGPGER
jgi:cytidylate kinase